MWVCVRKVGALGIFYPVEFKDINTKDEWFEKYSSEWELHHFIEDTIRGDYIPL